MLTDYRWISIAKPGDYAQLESLLSFEFAPKPVALRLAEFISKAVCGVLIENGYVDKDYRSTYYNFYAKKGRRYRDDCIRLHFFDSAVSFDEARLDLVATDGAPADHYFGYIVLRPTITSTIGRSIVSPDVRIGAKGAVIQSDHEVHVLGHELRVWGFPSMAQHSDISVCAHVSCWAILRHYSERYASHRELLIHDITMMAHPFDPGGLTPALGLNVAQAERIFQAAGSYPLIVSKRGARDVDFYVQMLAYLESGFPLFVAMYGQKHAVVAIGNDWSAKPRALAKGNEHVWPWVDTIAIVDDNKLPYASVPIRKPRGKAKTFKGYTVADFDSFIVPLPDKIFYPADAVERTSRALEPLIDAYFKAKATGPLLRRYFIMTLSGLRRYAREKESQLGEKLVEQIMRLHSARFVWIVEYATVAQWAAGHVHARAILDATASPNDPVPIWLIHDERQALLFDRDLATAGASIVDLKRPKSSPLGRIEQNLRPIKTVS